LKANFFGEVKIVDGFAPSDKQKLWKSSKGSLVVVHDIPTNGLLLNAIVFILG
jgi:hypothetical protein